MTMAEKIILTGDRPTGRLHVGHYAGSLRRRVELQNSGEYKKTFIMIADAQALTDNIENPEKVRQNIIEVALDYMSCGLDPAKATIFIQSQISELCELTFYYMDLVTVARLQRNPTVKSEIQMRNFEASIPVGFFTYPISQASDITAFKATTVPVGGDQLPMIEQTREIVHKFNTVYAPVLVEPKALLPENEACQRLPGIRKDLCPYQQSSLLPEQKAALNDLSKEALSVVEKMEDILRPEQQEHGGMRFG